MFTGPHSSTGTGWKLAWLYFGAVMLGYCLVILTAPLPPTFVDYPMWAYEGILFHSFITGHAVAGYTIKHYPIPQSMTAVMVGLLNLLFSWKLAIKLWICVYLALASIASWMMARAMRASSALLVITLPPVIFLNLDMWWGHISFEVGMCLVMMLIALALEESPSWILSLLLVAIFFCHMVACACALLFLCLWIFFTRQWRKVWIAAPTLLLSLWYTLGRIASGNADGGNVPEAANPYGSVRFLIFKASSYFKIFGYVNARTMDGLSQSEAIFGKPLFVALILFSLCLGGLCLYGLIRVTLVPRGRGTDRKELRAFVLLLIILAAFVPQIFLGSSDPGSRLVLMAASVGLFLFDWRSFSGKAVAVLGVLFCVVNFWQFARLNTTPTMPGHVADLPAPLLTYGQTYPPASVSYYEHLASGDMTLDISSTALFLRSK
jgi:hypothetical protein